MMNMKNNKRKIAIMGMGYVGLTLAAVMADVGLEILGVEVNKNILNKLKNGEPHFHERNLKRLIKKYFGKKLNFISEIPDNSSEVYIISVGTPIDENKKPISKYLENVSNDVALKLKKGDLVVLRSTVPVGTTRNLVKPILEKKSNLIAGKDFYLAFAPERTAEGNALDELRTNPQIIGGINEESVSITADLFRKLTHTNVVVSSLEAAEMVKIIDNSNRDLKFAYANEIANVCETIGIDAVEVIKAANVHYPRNDVPLPSPGVGGACLSKDPHILVDFSSKAGYYPKLIKLGRDINENIPTRMVERIKYKLEKTGKDIKNTKIFIIGFAFKGYPETSDMRDSPTILLLNELKKYNKNLYGFDPLVSKEEIDSLNVTPTSIEDGFNNADVVIFMTNNPPYYDLYIEDLIDKMNKPCVLMDGWHIFNSNEIKKIDGVIYCGIGFDVSSQNFGAKYQNLVFFTEK